MEAPQTLQEAVKYFSNPDNCVRYMISKRWPDGVVKCPTCGRTDATIPAKPSQVAVQKRPQEPPV